MSVIDRRALAPPALSGKRWVAALAGLALTGSTALLLWRLAPDAPAIVPIALAGLSGLSAGGLALALDEESLSNLAQGVLAGAGLIVLGAFAEPEARLRLFSFASPAFGVGLVLWLTCGAKAAALIVRPGGPVHGRARRPLRLRRHSRARLARSDDRRLHDLSRHLDDDRPIGRCGRVAAAGLGRHPVDHAGLCLGARAGSGPRAGADPADLAGSLHVRAARALRRAGAARAGDPGARPRPPRRPAPVALTPTLSRKRERGRLPSPVHGRGWPEGLDERSERGQPTVRRRRHFFRLPGRNGGRGARHAGCRRTRAHRLRASTGRAPRSPAGAGTRPRRADRADDPPRRLGVGADAICDVRLPALVCAGRSGNSDHAGDRGWLGRVQHTREISLERRRGGRRARRSHAARALKPGDRRLAAEPRRARLRPVLCRLPQAAGRLPASARRLGRALACARRP